MADIKQAALWMQDGKQVVRSDGNYPIYSKKPDSLILHKYDHRTETAVFTPNDLLADDWEEL